MSFSQEEVQARFPICLSGLRQLLSQVPDRVLMLPVCISSPFKYAPSDIAEHPHTAAFCPFTELEGEPTEVIFQGKLLWEMVTNQALGP